MRSVLKTILLLGCLGGGVWGMLTYAPETLRPHVPDTIQAWGPARHHIVAQQRACYTRAGSNVLDGLGSCLWQSIPVTVWVLAKYLFLSLLEGTYLPAILIGLIGGWILWGILAAIFGGANGLGDKLLPVMKKPMVVVTAILVAAAIFATDDYRFIPIALVVGIWIVYGLSHLGRHLIRTATTP